MNLKLFDQRAFDMAMRTDFVSLIEKVVSTVNSASPYQDNWHVSAIAWHLQQVLAGKIRRLIICLPPRSLKSIIASVAFPAWVLGQNPSKKIVSVTYSNSLAAKYANDFRLVVGAPWYCRAYPGTRISGRKDTEVETVFTAGGYRYSTSTTGTITGRGGDIVICDDPIKSQDVWSDVKREANNELFRNTILSRLDDKKTGAIVVVMQRLHANDFVGALIESDGDWTVLNLPAIAERDESIQIGDGCYHFRRAGEPLHADREPLSLLHQIRHEIGPDAWNAQFQQDPVPAGGVIIKREWLKFHHIEIPKSSYRFRIVQSWDTAGKVGPRNSFSVCTTWLIDGENYYLIDLIRGRFDFATLEDVAANYAKKFKPSVILVEDASTGAALAPRLSRSSGCRVELVPVQLDKAARLFFAAGKVCIRPSATAGKRVLYA